MVELFRRDAIEVLENEQVKKSLNRYFAILQNVKPAKFAISKRLDAKFNETDSLETLWKEHKRLTEEYLKVENEIDNAQKSLQELAESPKSYLDLKLEIARHIMQNCHFCHRKCGVNRSIGKRGYCKCGNTMMVSSIFAHLGEEPELVPSGTIFTMGCTMRCKHCQNWTISQWVENGTEYTPRDLAIEVEHLWRRGCRNANLVGGEPTPWLGKWLETFRHVAVNVPVVWNSNTYYSLETAQLLAGFVDVYLLDFKYGPGDCAEKISEAPEYWRVCTHNHLAAKKTGELVIRVLVLPNHLECCTKPTLEWIAKNLGKETRVNVMFQYRPEWHAYEVPELRRRLNKGEMQQAIKLATDAGLKNFIT